MGDFGELLRQWGYGTAVLYAGATFFGFYWLDKTLSQNAKLAFAKTSTLLEYNGAAVAAALVEVFDKLYTYPLLRLRAFIRSTLFTLAVSTAFLAETYVIPRWPELRFDVNASLSLTNLGIGLLMNVASDYLSLFVIRPWLGWSGRRPVLALTTGALIGVAVVGLSLMLRLGLTIVTIAYFTGFDVPTAYELEDEDFFLTWGFPVAASVVFTWLPAFAFGIAGVRLLTLLSRIVGYTQWAVKDGNEHPLVAIGYVASFLVFVVAAGGRLLFGGTT